MRYLIVANQTLNSEELEATVQLRADEGAEHLHIVVPATDPHDEVPPVEGDAVEVAEKRLESAIERFTGLGPTVSGEVGSAEPVDAVESALQYERCDSIIVGTLPKARSKWLRRDVVTRLQRRFPAALIEQVQQSAAPERRDVAGGLPPQAMPKAPTRTEFDSAVSRTQRPL